MVLLLDKLPPDAVLPSGIDKKSFSVYKILIVWVFIILFIKFIKSVDNIGFLVV